MTDPNIANDQPGLLEFSIKQERIEVGETGVGGQPGAWPTVMIGSMFYHGQSIFIDEDRDEFNEEEAEKRIRAQDDWSQKTGNPCLLDVVGASPQAIRRHLEFAARVTKVPLLVDGTTADVRLAGLEFVAENGLAERAVYNSIQPGIPDAELEAIQQAGVKAAVVLTYCAQDFTGTGRVDAVRELLPRVRDAGIDKLLIDTCVLDLATLGQACSAMHDVKQEFGVPVGGGVHNAVAMWKGLKKRMGEDAYQPCVAAACASAVAVGADFVLYGPVEDAKHIFPSVAMMDAALSQVAMERGVRLEKSHPRYRIG